MCVLVVSAADLAASSIIELTRANATGVGAEWERPRNSTGLKTIRTSWGFQDAVRKNCCDECAFPGHVTVVVEQGSGYGLS